VSKVQKALSREARSAYGEIQSGVQGLQKAIVEIRKGANRAEKKIEADARRQISELRKEARIHLGKLERAQRDAKRRLGKLATAADESWVEIKDAANAALKDATKTADFVIRRIRKAIGA
jgi:hypothetical protein